MTEVNTEFMERIQRVRAKCGYVQFDGRNDGQKFKFASAQNVLSRLQKGCIDECFITYTRDQIVNHQIEGKTAHAVVHTKLYVQDMYSPSVYVTEGVGSAKDNSGREVMQARTAAIKYALQGFGIMSWGHDPEEMTADEKQEYKARLDTIAEIQRSIKHAGKHNDADWLDGEGKTLIRQNKDILKLEDKYEETINLWKEAKNGR